MNTILRITTLLIFVNLATIIKLEAQTTLSADGSTDTYTLINSVLAPGYTAVETPDCSHEDFGDHIDQAMDDVLSKYVFRFHIHVSPDDDRCKNYDRQRTEIKTYDQSPDNLKAVAGEIVEYKWKFKLDKDFQGSSSFTHLHQVKAVGGSEEGMPLITYTARADILQLRYAEYATQTTIKQVDLEPFLGEWVEATEHITFGENGTYKVVIKRISDGVTVLSYENNDIRMWKTDAEFLRPKWGIYRSLDNEDDLRDEIILYNDFSIQELDKLPSSNPIVEQKNIQIHPNPTSGAFTITKANGASLELLDLNGKQLYRQVNLSDFENINIQLPTGNYLVKITHPQYTLTEKLIVG